MAELEEAVAEIRGHEGVEQVLLVGRDGLLVHQAGRGEGDVDTIAALTPGAVSACAAIAEAAEQGDLRTAVLEWERGVGIIASISADLLLVVLLQSGVGFAPLLRSIREQRVRLAGFLS